MLAKSVMVTGQIERIWQILEETLDLGRYEIVKTSPCTHIVAKRGSKLLGAVMSVDLKGGYRDLAVSVAPVSDSPNQYEVKFVFEFPSWTIGTPGAKNDCFQLVDDFASKVSKAKITPAATNAGVTCAKCKAYILGGTAFCSQCGEKVAALKPSGTCSGCGAPQAPGAAFCTACGVKISG